MRYKWSEDCLYLQEKSSSRKIKRTKENQLSPMIREVRGKDRLQGGTPGGNSATWPDWGSGNNLGGAPGGNPGKWQDPDNRH